LSKDVQDFVNRRTVAFVNTLPEDSSVVPIRSTVSSRITTSSISTISKTGKAESDTPEENMSSMDTSTLKMDDLVQTMERLSEEWQANQSYTAKRELLNCAPRITMFLRTCPTDEVSHGLFPRLRRIIREVHFDEKAWGDLADICAPTEAANNVQLDCHTRELTEDLSKDVQDFVNRRTVAVVNTLPEDSSVVPRRSTVSSRVTTSSISTISKTTNRRGSGTVHAVTDEGIEEQIKKLERLAKRHSAQGDSTVLRAAREHDLMACAEESAVMFDQALQKGGDWVRLHFGDDTDRLQRLNAVLQTGNFETQDSKIPAWNLLTKAVSDIAGLVHDLNQSAAKGAAFR